MGLGTSIFLIAAGAILRYAVTDTEIASIKIDVVGLILMIVGILGLVLSLFMWRNTPQRDRDVVIERDRIV